MSKLNIEINEVIFDNSLIKKDGGKEVSNLVIFAGVSGSGKTFIKSIFMSNKELNKTIKETISVTTRKPRANETDGKEYHFLTVEEFKTKINNNELIEWAEYVGNYYGTLKSEINKNPEGIVLLEIEMKGVKNMISKFPNATTIFLDAPEELVRSRLIERGTESKEVIESRIEQGRKERKNKAMFKYIIDSINGEKAAKEIINIINNLTLVT